MVHAWSGTLLLGNCFWHLRTFPSIMWMLTCASTMDVILQFWGISRYIRTDIVTVMDYRKRETVELSARMPLLRAGGANFFNSNQCLLGEIQFYIFPSPLFQKFDGLFGWASLVRLCSCKTIVCEPTLANCRNNHENTCGITVITLCQWFSNILGWGIL